MAPEITIRNQSDEIISLIAYSCHYGENPRWAFLVREKLARNIPARGHIKVKSEDYDLSGTNPGFQIQMLFRPGEFPHKVEPKEEEKVFLYTDLAATTEYRLTLDNNGRVNGGPGKAAGQTSKEPRTSGTIAAGTQNVSELERLKKQVQELQAVVKDLLQRVADLEKRKPNSK